VSVMTGTRRARPAERWLGWYVAALLAFLALPVLVVVPAAFSPGATLTFPPGGSRCGGSGTSRTTRSSSGPSG
jgi:ABC-type spermidine/putrescine transport system permease subunit II